MPDSRNPTPFADVNAVLGHLLTHTQALLGSSFQGMYLVGSLALGDFDRHTSDIDVIVLTATAIDDACFGRLHDFHVAFDTSASPWAGKVEVVYVPSVALRHAALGAASYPQIEKGTPLFKAPLELGWVFQCATLREYGVAVAGPDPRPLLDPIDPQLMPTAVAAIAGEWSEQAATDPDWLVWLRQRDHVTFVITTLCRMLYSLATGSVASKPRAAAWALQALDSRWATLVTRIIAKRQAVEDVAPGEMDETIAFIHFTLNTAQYRLINR